MNNKYLKKDPVYELEGKDFEEKKVIKKSFKGKNGIIKFYAPWCPHCENMVNDLNFLAKGLKNHGFVIGAVNTDNPFNKQIAMDMGVRGLPTLFSMNDKGELKVLECNRNIESLLENICDFTNKKVCKKKKNLNK